MDIVQLVHAVSDFATFIAYSIISYGVLHFAKKRPRHKKLLGLFTIFIVTCGLVHLSHVIFGPKGLDSAITISVLSVVNAFFSLLTAWVILPYIPRITEAQTQEEVDDQLAFRTTQVESMGKKLYYLEQKLAVLSDTYNVLNEVNKCVLRAPDIEHLIAEICNVLCLFGKAQYVWIGECTEGKCSVLYATDKCPPQSLLPDIDLDEFFDGQNMVIETSAAQKTIYLHVHSRKSDYVLFAAYDLNINNKYIDVLVSAAHDFEFALTQNETQIQLQEAEHEKLEAKASLNYITTHDKTTGLLNRESFANTIKNHFLIEGSRLALFFVDICDYEELVNSEGHYFGDAVLIDVVSRLNSVTKKTDQLGRFGKNEFVLVSEGSDTHVQETVSKINGAFETPITLNGSHFFLSVSIGVALYPKDADNWEDLVTIADKAQSLKKKKYAYCDGSSVQVSKVGQLLKRDIGKSRLTLVYQPQVNIFTNEIVGLEALARWHSKELGSIDAPIFVQVAEYYGIVTELGSWVIKEACRQWREWVDQGMPLIRLCINISALQLRDCSVLPILEQAMEINKIPSSFISIEVSESVLARGLTVAEECVAQIRGKGIRVSIDDFGSGYSSLAYLKHFKSDEIKISPTFVPNDDTSNTSIIKSILRLAEDLKLSAVAEGVETTDQKQALRDLGCMVAQGNLFYPPMTPDKIVQTVKETRQ